MVNFFASVHRTYSVDSNLHEMGDSNGTDDMDTDADHDPPAVTPQPTTPCTITMPGNGNGEAFPSLASSPSEATLLPEPSPTGSAMSSGNEEGCTNAVGGGQTCKEEEEAAAEASVAEEPSVKRQKVAIDGC